MAETINVCLACDDNYAKYAGVVIASVLANADNDDKLAFYILDGGISEGKKSEISSLTSIKNCEIFFIPIDETLFEEYKKIKTHDYITIATYYRLKLPSLLPKVNRIIYFDCDFVVNSSLKDLFASELDGCVLGGVKDLNEKMVKENPNYINAGMIVMDLERMRIENTEDHLLQWTKEHSATIKTGDQEILNTALKGKIKLLAPVWNVQSSNFTNRSSYTRNPKAIHFVAARKPWHFGSFSYHKNLYFKYLQLTPWALNEKEYRHWTLDNQIISILRYIKYRPLFFLRPRFYKALFYTYFKNPLA